MPDSSKLNSAKSVYVRGVGEHPPVDVERRHLSWARIPFEIAVDRRLSHAAVRVYCVLACAERGGLVTMGERLMADRACMDRRNLNRSLLKLREVGAIVLLPRQGRDRARYRLTSALFGALQPEVEVSANQEEPPSESAPIGAPASKKKPVALAICPNCRRQQPHKLLKIGWCRSCNQAKRQEIKMRRVAETVYDERVKATA